MTTDGKTPGHLDSDQPARATRRPTIRDIAEAAAVSVSTASRALNGHGYAAEAVRLRVQRIATELGYVPDAQARNLRKQVSRSIGVLVSDLRNSFYADLAAGVSGAARASGYTMMLADLGNRTGSEVDAVKTFVSMRVAGVIVTPMSAAVAAYLEGQQIPVVEVDRQFAPKTCDAIVVENRNAARAVTEHLLALGHRRIALFIDETDWTTGRDRFEGFREAMEGHGVEVDPALILSSAWDVVGSQAVALGLFQSAQRPTALFAANNVLAEGAWRAAAQAGLRIPEDLSLASFDDAPWMSMVTPTVTAVAQDAVALGEAAVSRLVERIADPEAAPRTVVHPAPLIVRGSTAPPR